MSEKKKVLAKMITSVVIGLLLGALIVVLAGVLDVSFVLKWAIIITGIIIIISNVPSLITGILNIKTVGGLLNLILSLLGIGLGALMIFMQNEVLTIIVAIYLIAFPIVSIVLSKDWKNQIKSEWLKILIGVLLIAFLPAILSAADAVVKVVMIVAGWAVIGISLILFAISLYSWFKSKKKAENTPPDFIETEAEDSNE